MKGKQPPVRGPYVVCGSLAEVHLGILINQKRKMKSVGELTQVTRKNMMMMMVERERRGTGSRRNKQRTHSD
jgi:hypothetical protein